MSTLEPAAEPHDAISQRAADFFQRRRFWEWSDADEAEFEAWLDECAAHRVAYLRVEGIVARTEQLASLRPPKPDAIPEPVAPGATHEFRPWRYVVPLLAAASIALIAAFEPTIVNYLTQTPDRIYSTDVGGRTLLTFADHTQIELDTNSLVRFRMTGEERTVWLERGAAWFHVAHNAANPFSVIVGKHRITDLGTEFLVRRASDSVEVALVNGRATLATEGAQTAMLIPGDDAVATPVSVSVTRKTQQELADELAWQHGMLVFRNARLADVVREFNRYNTTKLVIADPSISDLKFSAELKIDDYEGFLQLAQAAMKLRAERDGNDILISRMSRHQTKRAAHSKHGD